MRFFQILGALLWLLVSAVFATDNGLTDAVTWDQYSLLVNDTRVYI